MKSLLLGLALSVAAVTAYADDDITLYKVEVIVFENLDPNAIHAEVWPANPGTPSLDDAVELSAITAPPAAPDTAPAPNATPVSSAPAGTAAATSTAPGDAAPQPASGNAAAASPTGGMTPLAVSSAAADTSAPADTTTPPPAPRWQWLDDSELSLNPQVKRLNDSPNYKTILHVGWVQPVDSTDQGKAIHLYDGMESTRGDETAIPLTTDPTTGPPPVAHEDDQAAAQATKIPAPVENDMTQPRQEPDQSATDAGDVDAAPPSHILDGTFTLRRGRFLHVDVDLGYTKTVTVEQPAPVTDNGATTASDIPPNPPQTTDIYVRMIDSRRVRDDSLNYLDHPLFGVLFTVTPYQPPAADTPAKP